MNFTVTIGTYELKTAGIHESTCEKFTEFLEDMRSRIEEYFYTLGIEIEDLKVDKRVLLSVDPAEGDNTLVNIDKSRYEVQVFFGKKGRYMITTFMIDRNIDAFKTDWYLVDLKIFEQQKREGIWIGNQNSFCGPLSSCVKIIKGELERW